VSALEPSADECVSSHERNQLTCDRSTLVHNDGASSCALQSPFVHLQAPASTAASQNWWPTRYKI